jgi:hypothetical protein
MLKRIVCQILIAYILTTHRSVQVTEVSYLLYISVIHYFFDLLGYNPF